MAPSATAVQPSDLGNSTTTTTPTQVALCDLFSVKGKTAICTGATGGIGKELCTTLAEAGCDIVSIQLSNDPAGPALKEAVEALGSRFTAYEANVGDSEAVRRCFADIWAAGIEAEILLNAAGINKRGTMCDLTDQDIDAVLAVNLKGSFVCCQEFSKRLLEQHRPGKIINIASMTSFIGMYNVSAYAASKGGVLQMTRAFSNELAEKGIQVNCICPGYFNTPLTAAIQKNPEYNDLIMRRTPARRWGEPKDLRGALLFLASPASDYVSGAPIIVDGGMLGM